MLEFGQPSRKCQEMKNYQFSREIKIQVSKLRELDNYSGVLALAEDFIIIFISFCISHWISFWFYPFAVFVIGSRQRALTNILHESTHSVLARNSTLNYLLGTFGSGYLVFQTFDSYYRSHITGHHGNLGNKKLDPDFQSHLSAGLYDQVPSNFFFINYILKPLLGMRSLEYLMYVFKNRLFNSEDSSTEKIHILSLWIGIIFLGTVTGTVNILLLYWILPFFTSFVAIGWFIELCEHFPLVSEYNIDVRMTRNRKSGCIERFFFATHNEHYHLEHHLCPRVPFWQLDKVNKIHRQDPVYARIDDESSGIFSRGNSHNPSIIRQILNFVEETRSDVSDVSV